MSPAHSEVEANDVAEFLGAAPRAANHITGLAQATLIKLDWFIHLCCFTLLVKRQLFHFCSLNLLFAQSVASAAPLSYCWSFMFIEQGFYILFIVVRL